MAAILEITSPKYMGTAAEFAAVSVVVAGSLYWVWDTNILYKTYDGTNWVLYLTLG